MINKYIILVLCISSFRESSGQSNNGGGSQRSIFTSSLADVLRQNPTGFGLPRPSDVLVEVPIGGASDAAILSDTNLDNLDPNNLVGVTDGFGEPGIIEPVPSILTDPIQDGFGKSPEKNPADVSQESLRSKTATAGSFGPGSGKTRRRRRKRPRKQPKLLSDSIRPVDILIDASVGATHEHDIPNTHGNHPDSTVVSSSTITDVHGNNPPPPSGVHIDLPGEHGNMNDFPVVHSGEDVILSDAGMVDFNPGSSLVKPDTASTVVDIPLEPAVPMEISKGTDVPALSEVAGGINTAVRVDQSDPMVTQSRNIFHASNVHNIFHDALPTTEEFVDLTDSGFGLGTSHKSIHTTQLTNPTAAKPSDLPNSELISDKQISLSDGFISPSDGFVSTPDIPKTIESVPKVVNKGLDGTGIAKVHVDMPGEHGNPIDGTPVIHRAEQPHFGSHPLDNGAIPGQPVDVPLGHVHVDMPGEHGNPVDGAPVIHRTERSHSGSHPFDNGATQGHSLGTPLGNVHVDMPGEHGNPIDGAPVIHRAEPPHFGSHPWDNGATQGHSLGTSLGNVHVDMPGEHGNPIDGAPVIHRAEQPHFGSHPLDNGATQGHSLGTPLGSVHIDMPGEHGNPIDGVPIVHRNEPAFVPNGPMNDVHLGTPIEAPLGNVHVDMPGDHGNPINGAPVVHRDGHTVGSHIDHGIHIDAPGEHGNTMNEPALHLPPGATINDARAAGVLPGITNDGSIFRPHVIPGKTNVPLPVAGHDNTVHVDMTLQHNNPVNGVPLIHHEKHPNVGPNIGPHNSIHGIHIDAPGEHGNTLDEPALHLPPGATIADARAAGVIPKLPTDGRLIATGFLPGSANVPVPGKPGHDVLVPHVPKKRPSLGDILGLPTTNLPGKHNTLSEFMPVPVEDREALLNYGRNGRGRGPWRGRRKGGRRGGRRRGGKGRKGKNGKRKNDTHDHDHFHPKTTTTTTSAPKSKPGNGITIIRTSRPNPLGNLGNILRSALTGGGSGGGGLLGSLMKTALGAINGGGGFRGFGPAPGPVMMIPGGRPMFGGIFG